MTRRRVVFVTDADPIIIRECLRNFPGNNQLEVVEFVEDEPVRKPMSRDLKHILIIWGMVFFALIASFLFIEWETRP